MYLFFDYTEDDLKTNESLGNRLEECSLMQNFMSFIVIDTSPQILARV